MKQECKDCNKSLDDCTCIEDTIDMKQETLEEAAERYTEEHKWEEQDPWFDFMEGAKWQQERSYSEEEVKDIMAETWIRCVGNDGNDFKELRDKILEQFKNK